MEINRSDVEKPQQIAWSTSDGQVLDQVRSYRCTFCKRSFSNAQALGGHMNIHRKDRARLKGSSPETLIISMDHIMMKNSSSCPPASSNEDLLQVDTIHDHDHGLKSCAHKRPRVFSEEDEESPRRKYGYKEVLQLPLLVETSSTSNDIAKTVQLKHGSSSLELDLELRLGPDPQYSSCINKTTTGNRSWAS